MVFANKTKAKKIGIKYIDGARFGQACLAGIEEVINHEKYLNKINVFPIPDKDTGTNLKATFSFIFNETENLSYSLEETASFLAKRMNEEAKGYSGIIFSQFFTGFSEKLKGKDKILVEEFILALDYAVSKAYRAISDPCEGTVLTMFRKWSEEIKKLVSSTEDLVIILKESLKKAWTILEETPNYLDVLAKSKVVDAGAQAFVYFLEGVAQFIEEGEREKIIRIKNKDITKKKPRFDKFLSSQYYLECVLKGEAIDFSSLKEKLEILGHNLVFSGTRKIIKIHLLTQFPKKVSSFISNFGCILRFNPISSSLKTTPSKRVAIVTDSSCDISDEIMEKNDIFVLPLKIQMREKTYLDKVEILPEEFYFLLTSSPSFPKTSQPSFKDFSALYQHLLKHYQSVISIHLSSKLSGTYQSALQAAQSFQGKRISVIDSKSASVGLGLIILEGLKFLRQGLDCKKIINSLKRAVEKSYIFVAVPSLKYLVKGGRVSKSKGLLAKILNINPILAINREGLIESVAKVKGKSKLIDKMLEITFQLIGSTHNFSLAVAHSNAPQLGEKVADELTNKLSLDKIMVLNAAPVLGAHAGPGAVAIAILKQ
ncbi:MAG: DegV family protein [Candidatus Aminicenantia bacterium]